MSVVIIKSGIDMLREAISEILGERADISLSQQIKATAREFPQVEGVYDLILHNYGPDSFIASFHIEVPDTLSAADIDRLTRQITYAVYLKCHVLTAAISVYSINTQDNDVIEIRENIRKIVMEDKNILQMHGFYLDEENKKMRFDLVVSFNSSDRHATFMNALKKVQEVYPDYEIRPNMDADYSET